MHYVGTKFSEVVSVIRVDAPHVRVPFHLNAEKRENSFNFLGKFFSSKAVLRNRGSERRIYRVHSSLHVAARNVLLSHVE